MPAGFQNGDVASSATAENAPPMPTARAPTGIFMNSPAYLVALAGTTATARPAMANSSRIGFRFIQLPGWSAWLRFRARERAREARDDAGEGSSLGKRPISCQPDDPWASTPA